MPTSYELKQISPKEVAFSDTNPRGEKEEDILRDREYVQLKDSVSQFGVLVPIVVHRQTAQGAKPFRLVDGERRLRAALATRQKRIPAHIAARTDETHDLVQAFHIHMLRKQWKSVAMARSFKNIWRQLKSDNPKLDERGLMEEVQIRTGCTDKRMKDLRRVSRYSDAIVEKVGYSHLVQIEESFVERLETSYPKVLAKHGKTQVRKAMVLKAKHKILSSTRALMDCIVPVLRRASTDDEKKAASDLIEKFITVPELPAEEVLRRFGLIFPSAHGDVVSLTRKLIASAEELESLLSEVKMEHLAGFPSMARKAKEQLANLKRILASKHRALARMIKE